MPESGRHLGVDTIPGSTRSRPAKNLATSSRVRPAETTLPSRSLNRLVISAISAAWISLAGWETTR